MGTQEGNQTKQRWHWITVYHYSIQLQKDITEIRFPISASEKKKKKTLPMLAESMLLKCWAFSTWQKSKFENLEWKFYKWEMLQKFGMNQWKDPNLKLFSEHPRNKNSLETIRHRTIMFRKGCANLKLSFETYIRNIWNIYQ